MTTLRKPVLPPYHDLGIDSNSVFSDYDREEDLGSSSSISSSSSAPFEKYQSYDGSQTSESIVIKPTISPLSIPSSSSSNVRFVAPISSEATPSIAPPNTGLTLASIMSHPILPSVPDTPPALITTKSTSAASTKSPMEESKGIMLTVLKPHKSVYTLIPVTNSFIQLNFSELWHFSHLERDDGQIIMIERKPDYQYSLEVGHSYALIPQSPNNSYIYLASNWLWDLFEATLGKLLLFNASDTILIFVAALLQIASIALEHNLVAALHNAYPQPPKSPYFEYRQPRWKYECSERVELIIHFVAQQPTAFLAILFFARRRLRLEVTRAIILVAIYTFTLHGIVLYLTLDILEHKISMDWLQFILNWYRTVIYFFAVAALGLRR